MTERTARGAYFEIEEVEVCCNGHRATYDLGNENSYTGSYWAENERTGEIRSIVIRDENDFVLILPIRLAKVVARTCLEWASAERKAPR